MTPLQHSPLSILPLTLFILLFSLGNAQCRSSPRSIDGSCTKIESYIDGKTNTAQFSYFYSLDSSRPHGGTLKSAREISNIVHASSSSKKKSTRKVTDFSVFFGQFLDHDIISTPVSNNRMNINVPSTDANFRTSLSFKRSKLKRSSKGQMRPENEITGAIDLSAVYGSDDRRARELRQHRDGLLKMDTGWDSLGLPPVNKNGLRNAPTDQRIRNSEFALCGDHRCNENPSLLGIHTVFLREHNRLAREVKKAKPGYSDEVLYQAARAINIAQFSQIVYAEYVPAMIGQDLAPACEYSEEAAVGPSIIFGTAGFRMGHSLVNDTMASNQGGGRTTTHLPIEQVFFKPLNDIRIEQIESYLRPLPTRLAMNVDVFVNDKLRNVLFQKRDNFRSEDARDLVANNIMRCRDHACPTFNEVRDHLGLGKLKSFGKLKAKGYVRKRLKRAYGSIRNIELWPGLLAEKPYGRSALGQTATKLWKMEFERMRSADFYYFDPFRGLPSDIYDLPQTSSAYLNSVNMRDILLRNTRLTAREVPRNVFRL